MGKQEEQEGNVYLSGGFYCQHGIVFLAWSHLHRLQGHILQLPNLVIRKIEHFQGHFLQNKN